MTTKATLKPLLLIFVLAGAGISGCGSTGRTGDQGRPSSRVEAITTATGSPKSPVDSDDADNSMPAAEAATNTENYDDHEVEFYGHRANTVDMRTATAFAKRYFAAAAAHDGAAACSLLLPGLARVIPKSYGRPPNPHYMRGKTCPQVMSKLLAHRHRMMAAGFTVKDVRVAGDTAFILLSFKAIAEPRYMGVRRYGDTWRLEALIDSEYP